MTDSYVFEQLAEEQREEMYKRALIQLEAQLFECHINLHVVLDPNGLDQQTGESLNQKIERIHKAIDNLKQGEDALLH